MKVVSVVCLVLALTVAAFAQQKFTADFEFRQTSMRGGVVTGTVQYDWANRGIRFYYTTSKLEEIYKFNEKYGRETGVTTQYVGQWLYRNSDGCDCQTSSLTIAMPKFYKDTTDYKQTGETKVFGTQTCEKFAAKSASELGGVRLDVVAIYFNGNTLCHVELTGGRSYTFSNVNTSPSFQSSVFNTPAGCKCGKPVDIVIVLDRSSSINYNEFLREKAFTEGFLRSFRYGPLGANVALVHFMKTAWTTLTLTEGTNEAYVNQSIDKALKCCDDYYDKDKNRCCCCGTSISSGVIEGTKELLTGRAGVEKILITVTDGYHNHNRSHLPCSKGGEPCKQDLQFSVDEAYRQIPGLVSFGVGVGDLKTEVSLDELTMLAGGNSERILSFADFDELATGFLDVVGLACQVDETPCGDCCGFCSCGGECVAPDSCEQVEPCTDNAISGMCCKAAPKACVAPNKCTYSACDSQTDACVESPVTCPADTECLTWACDADTGRCVSTKNSSVGCFGKECEIDDASTCDDNDACTIELCTANETCAWETRVCDDNNSCTVDSCDPVSGCVHEPYPADHCDDQNSCTTDSCVPSSGCVHETITCPNDENGCTVEECDPLHGCRSSILNCSAPVDDDEREARNESVVPADICRFYSCNATLGACGFRDQDCAPAVGLSTGAVAGLTAGIIAAIVIAVIVAVVLLGGGGAFAYSKAMGGGPAATLTNNPLYAGKGAEGVNPLHRG